MDRGARASSLLIPTHRQGCLCPSAARSSIRPPYNRCNQLRRVRRALGLTHFHFNHVITRTATLEPNETLHARPRSIGVPVRARVHDSPAILHLEKDLLPFRIKQPKTKPLLAGRLQQFDRHLHGVAREKPGAHLETIRTWRNELD